MTDEALTPTAPLTSPRPPASPAPASTLGPASTPAPASPLRPRTRWAGIVWGAVFAALAFAGISLTSRPASLDDVATGLLTISVGAVVGYALLAVGALVLIIGLVGLLRHAQVALTRRTQAGAAPDAAASRLDDVFPGT